jgi:thiamine pyrophosphate-dependent acetolactate synthase large subunit-like protein
MGSHDLIEEASQGRGRLLECAADLVPPLKKALDSREPSVVTVAIELMKNVLKAAPEVIFAEE